MRTLLLFFLLLNAQLSFSTDYTKIDSIVNKYPKTFKSIESFAEKIKSDFSRDIDKTRAAYYWISNNIMYDFKSANSVRSSGYHYYDDSELMRVQIEYAENVLRKKTGVCEGYSQLLKYVLDRLEIKCEVIDGYAKTDFKEIGKVKNEENHAWNAVFLENRWQLIDATWSTGNEPNKPNHFSFRDSYFLIKPEYLIWSHFPKDKKWQLLDEPISKLSFFYAPIIHVGYYNCDLKLNEMKGLVKSNKIIQLSFNTINEDNQYYYQYNQNSLNLEPLEFTKKGDVYIAQIPYDYKKGKELLIFNGFKPCLSFKIN